MLRKSWLLLGLERTNRTIQDRKHGDGTLG